MRAMSLSRARFGVSLLPVAIVAALALSLWGCSGDSKDVEGVVDAKADEATDKATDKAKDAGEDAVEDAVDDAQAATEDAVPIDDGEAASTDATSEAGTAAETVPVATSVPFNGGPSVTRWVKTFAVNVRTGPSKESPVVRHMARGHKLSVSIDGEWAKVGEGEFVSINALTDKDPLAKKAVKKKKK
jgi:hypothetical protein